jgi:phage tail sheath protein FI
MVTRLEGSEWVRAAPDAAFGIGPALLAEGNASPFALFPRGEPISLDGGFDNDPVDSEDIIGLETPPRSGLKALEAQDGINIIAAPGLVKQVSEADPEDALLVAGELIAQAERKMDRFAVFESNDDSDIGLVLQFRNKFNSRFGAMYHPWLRTRDPATNVIIPVPPSGHVMGAYARTDNERGVFKAPANVVVRGISGFTRDIPDGEQDILNPAGVNVLRRFDGLGNVIWGARTISSETLWRYVPVRRLFIFIEQSLVRGTRFAVFEPNDLKLWARLRDGVTNFLTTQWRAGALFGAKPEEAFFVKVDETTTTEEDRQLGRVNIIVGIAPVRPAEFIIFQIGQAPQSVIIAEQG